MPITKGGSSAYGKEKREVKRGRIQGEENPLEADSTS